MEPTSAMGHISLTRQAIIASSMILASALIFPRFSFIRAMVFGLAVLVVTLGFIVVSAIKTILRREASELRRGVPPILRSLTFTTPSAWSAVLTRQTWEEQSNHRNEPTLLTHSPEAVRAALDNLLRLIQRHFILPWYARISPSPAFPNSTDNLIRHVLVNLITQGESVDWSSILVSRMTPIVKDHLQNYRLVEYLAPSSQDVKNALPLPLPTKAHPALSSQDHTSLSGTSPLVEVHLRDQVERIVNQVLPDSDRSEVVKVLVREIVLGAVLLPVFDMLCDPDFWNRQIDDRGGRYLHEQKQVNRFLSALSTIPDTPSTTVTPVKSRNTHSQTSFISATSTSQQFDAFIKSISRLKTLGEARRFRADIERERRLARITLQEEEAKEEAGKNAERAFKSAGKYVQRLERAGQAIDARIATLSGQTARPDMLRSPQSVSNVPTIDIDVSLSTVLLDPSSLAYWLEFMERRNRSKLVQFWLTVEGFKDPLEVADLTASFSSIDSDHILTNSSTLKEDTAFLYEMYFASGPDMGVSSRDISVIQEFVNDTSGHINAGTIAAAKRSIFSAQRAVYDQMIEEDWKEFKKTELYRKALQDLTRNIAPLSPRQNSFFSPRSVTSPHIPPAPPSKPARHVSSPVIDTRAKRPPIKTGPSLINGSFTPTTITPSPSVSTTPPTFSRAISQKVRPTLSAAPSAFGASSSSSEEKIGIVRPRTPPKRQNHLDVLMTGNNSPSGPEHDRRIFEDDAEGVQDDEDEYIQIQRMEAIQAALSEIIASDDMINSRVEPPTYEGDTPEQSLSASLVLSPVSERPEIHELASRSVDDLLRPGGVYGLSSPDSREFLHVKEQPDLDRPASTSQIPSTDRTRLFDDDLDTSEHVNPQRQPLDPEYVQLAAPGNLHLGPEIAKLGSRVQELVKQENLLESLIRRAELTGNEAELKILHKSISAIRRELRSSVFQKAQYEQQEEENRLIPGRTQVSVPSAHVTADTTEGKQIARYAVKISQGGQGGSWVVYRRYNQFFELDRAVREWAAVSGDRELSKEVKGLVELPGKRLGPSTSAGLMEIRRQGLERYLKSLVTSDRLCASHILRDFFSRSSSTPITQTTSITTLAPHNIVRSLYKSVATTLDETPLGPSMLDLIQSTLNRQFSDVAEGLGEMAEILDYGSSFLSGGLWKTSDAQALQASPEIGQGANGVRDKTERDVGNTVFTAPICDLFIEVFDLDESSWLKRQAIVVILQQFLGSTIERVLRHAYRKLEADHLSKVRDTLRSLTTPDTLERLLTSFQDTLFPDGERRPPSEERTSAEKMATRQRASRKLALLIPDIAANMIGRSNSRRAARRVFGVLQDKRLNQHLILRIMDEIISAMFPVQARPKP